ncbi:MAG: hypothetical protein FDZ75_09220, partial [Actinobacteria bacterium]
MKWITRFTLLAVCLMLALAAATAFAAVGGFSDTFDTYDTGTWAQLFSNAGNTQRSADLGSVVASGGLVTARATNYRGGSALMTKQPVITSLPARVKFRIMFPGSAYRAAFFMLNSAPYDLTSPQPQVIGFLGTTHHLYLSRPHVQATQADGAFLRADAAGTPLIPCNTMMTGEMTVTA